MPSPPPVTDFDKVVAKIEQGMGRAYNCIPCPFPRFRKYFPGLMFAQGHIVTANSGVGKSQLSRYLFINHPLRWVKDHPEADIRLKIILFTLEESREMWLVNSILNQLSEVDGIELSIFTLLGVATPEDRSKLTPEVLQKIKGYKAYFEQLATEIEVVDSVTNPYGMWLHVLKYAHKHGDFYWVATDPDGKVVSKTKVDLTKAPMPKWNHYEPHDPRELVLIVTDHISLLHTEAIKGQPGDRMSQAQTMEKWSGDYCMQIRNKLGYSYLNVQQQSASSEAQEYTYKGASIEAKLEPSLSDLGDSKKTGRDPEWVLGLFAPDRYELTTHRGYDITKLGDRYRSLKLLKVRYGKPNTRIGLYFKGEVNHFEELPEAALMQMDPSLYDSYT